MEGVLAHVLTGLLAALGSGGVVAALAKYTRLFAKDRADAQAEALTQAIKLFTTLLTEQQRAYDFLSKRTAEELTQLRNEAAESIQKAERRHAQCEEENAHLRQHIQRVEAETREQWRHIQRNEQRVEQMEKKVNGGSHEGGA